jgi:proteasome lid subunit RPN8/RPN11
MLELSQAQADEIRKHGEQDYPHECCGLLIGQFKENGFKVVLETYPISNAREEEAKRNRFLITPQELMRGEKYARERKLDIVGFYHSHPNCPAVPSGYDLEHAWPTYSYIITSVVEGRAVDLKSWEQEPDRSKFNSEELVIKGNSQ